MQELMEQWRETIKKLHACPARRIDRHLYVYVQRRLDRPEPLDTLAHAIFERI